MNKNYGASNQKLLGTSNPVVDLKILSINPSHRIILANNSDQPRLGIVQRGESDLKLAQLSSCVRPALTTYYSILINFVKLILIILEGTEK